MSVWNILKSFFGAAGSTSGLDVSAAIGVPFGAQRADAPDMPDDSEIPADVAAAGFSKNIGDCHRRIRNAYPLVEAAFKMAHPDMGLKCDYTYRSKERQFELFKKGRELQNGVWVVVDRAQVVTDKDGSKPSHHQTYPAQAADVYITRGGQIIWSDPDLYTELGGLWDSHGLVSGATWKYSWKDWDHVQVEYPII